MFGWLCRQGGYQLELTTILWTAAEVLQTEKSPIAPSLYPAISIHLPFSAVLSFEFSNLQDDSPGTRLSSTPIYHHPPISVQSCYPTQ